MKLSDIPYEQIELGLQVISAINIPGIVVEKYNAHPTLPPHPDNDWLTVEWENGNMSTNEHFCFSKVTVK